MKSIFKTDRKENLQSRLKRFRFNFFPAYRRTGARICFISSDWREVHIKLPLNWKTKNIVGSVFGGSIYGALDPIYMTQLIMILGKNYIVWDKSASIKFLKPVKRTVYARFLITEEIINEIKTAVQSKHKHDVILNIVFQDKDGTIYVDVCKELYIADSNYYNMKNNSKG